MIKVGQKLPKEYIYKLFADEEDVFLFWNGRKEEVTNVALPFHSINRLRNTIVKPDIIIKSSGKTIKKPGNLFATPGEGFNMLGNTIGSFGEATFRWKIPTCGWGMGSELRGRATQNLKTLYDMLISVKTLRKESCK